MRGQRAITYFLGLLTCAVVLCGVAGPSYAAFYADWMGIDGDYLYIEDDDDFYDRAHRFNINNDLDGYSLDQVCLEDAYLRITFAKTNGSEFWSMRADGVDLGDLPATESWQQVLTRDYPILGPALDALKEDGRLRVEWFETTPGLDSFKIFSAKVYGEYSVCQPVVPEPSTMALFGVGALAAGWRRLRRRNGLPA